MESPLVSVVIPIYNTGAFLVHCVDSVINQTYQNLEILLIDDGSTDTSPEICDTYAKKDTRVKVFHKKNEGQSCARNLGINKTTGKYIYFLDSDDFIDINTIKVLCEDAEKDNLDVLTFETIVVDEQGREIVDKYAIRNNQDRYSAVMEGKNLYETLIDCKEYRIFVPVFFIKRELLTGFCLSFYPGIVHEDELFVFLLYMYAARIKHISKAFFYRRIRVNSTMTSAKSERNFIGMATIFKEILQYGDTVDDNVLKKTITEHLVSLFISTLRLYEVISQEERRKNAALKREVIDEVKKRAYLRSKKVKMAAFSMKVYMFFSEIYHTWILRRNNSNNKGD